MILVVQCSMGDMPVWTYVRAVMSIMFHLASSNTATERPIPSAVPNLELQNGFSIVVRDLLRLFLPSLL
jgi:hypothetical protein